MMLVGAPPSTIVYNRASGRYRDAETGQFVPRERVLLEVDREMQKTQTRLQGVTRLLASDKITIEEWQTRMASEIKDSHLRMTALGGGGMEQLSSRHFGFTGQRLRSEYEYLAKFAEDLESGSLTPEQALRRAGMYGESVALSFHTSEQVTKERDGFEAKRSLDASARHCKSCIDHVTYGWVDAAEVTPPGTACECRRRCRCVVVYRKRRRKNGNDGTESGAEDQS